METVRPSVSFPASTIAWRRACVTCTKAKRQCSKQVPRCRRCVEKGLLCTYPPPRRPELSATAAVEEASFHLANNTLQHDGGPITTSADVASHLEAPDGPDFTFLQVPMPDFERSGLPTQGPEGSPQTAASTDALVSLRGLWFLSPDSWNTEFTEPPPTTVCETERSLKQYIEQVQLWMRQWVTEGHSPLHHRELYTFHMPRHTQDAYTAMTMYMSKTRETEATVHRILEDRVSQLLQDQDVEESLGSAGGGGLSIFARLSRVQALLCYQLIRLFDGDIRMRGQAENLIPTLSLWNRQMLESAKASLGHPERFLVSSSFDSSLQPNAYSTTVNSSPTTPKAIWQAWVVAESVRRTWQATNVVQEVYLFLKRGWSDCPGRLPSTMRKTLWDAPSAYSWMRELKGGKDPLLLPMARLEELFAQSPAEIDDFNVASMSLYGMERLDQWLEEKAHRQPHSIPGLESLLYMVEQNGR